MVAAKTVHLIIQKFKNSELKHSHNLILAGGYMDKAVQSELNKLTNDDQITYIGKYNGHLSLKRRLKNIGCDNGFFISWNTQEPFGLVYQEAIELNLLPVFPIHIGFTEILKNSLAKQLSFSSLESAFSAIHKIPLEFNLQECKEPPADDIQKFLNYTADDCVRAHN
jgi:hypothetical protein